MKKILLIAGLTLLLAGCAQAVHIDPSPGQYIPGFLMGCLHGLIIVFDLIGSFFSNDIAIYAKVNSGVGYNCGFVFGVWAWFTAWSKL